MEEKTTLIKYPDNEIAYVIAKVYGVTVKFMIDTGANVSLSCLLYTSRCV